MTIWTEFGGTAFSGVFFFLRPRRKYTGKKPTKNSVNKIQAKSGEIPVLKNLGKIF